MDLTIDIIRDVLICIKSHCEYYTNTKGSFCASPIGWRIIYEDDVLNSKYDIDDIKYCILKLNEGGLIKVSIGGTPNRIHYLDIDDITWEGHEFLKNIEDDSFWHSFKKKLGESTKFSVGVLVKLVAEATFNYAKEKLGIV